MNRIALARARRRAGLELLTVRELRKLCDAHDVPNYKSYSRKELLEIVSALPGAPVQIPPPVHAPREDPNGEQIPLEEPAE